MEGIFRPSLIFTQFVPVIGGKDYNRVLVVTVCFQGRDKVTDQKIAVGRFSSTYGPGGQGQDAAPDPAARGRLLDLVA